MTFRNSISPTLKQRGWRLVRWTAIDTVLGTVGGGVFGALFGGFSVLLRHDPSQVIPMAGYFALCGATAGALLGLFGAAVDGEEACEPVRSQSVAARPDDRPVELTRDLVPAQGHRPHHRLAAFFRTNRKRNQTLELQDPSRN